MCASRAGDRQVHQIGHLRADCGVDQRDLVTDLSVAGPIAHKGLVGAGERRSQRGSVIEVDAHDLELGITESGAGRLGVAGQDPHLLAVTHKRLSQCLTDKSGSAGQRDHVEPFFRRAFRLDVDSSVINTLMSIDVHSELSPAPSGRCARCRPHGPAMIMPVVRGSVDGSHRRSSRAAQSWWSAAMDDIDVYNTDTILS